jgi:hypothetical protein
MKAKLYLNRLKTALVFFLSATMLLTWCNTAFGQTTATDSVNLKPNYWGSIGGGPTTLGAVGLNADVNAEISDHWFISTEGQVETQTFLNLFGSNVSTATLNVLAWKIFKQRLTFITVSAGLGLVDLNTFSSGGLFSTTPSTSQDQYALNVPIEVNVYFVPVTPFAVGVGAYLNLNAINTTAGITVRLAFGRMSTHAKQRRPRRLPWQKEAN